jgi:PIN domain nuclease of toxin-antitoxin system
VVVWLYAGLTHEFSEHAVKLIEHNDLLISPMVQLELVYLHETKRIMHSANTIINELQSRIGLKICDISFETIIHKAITLDWTRDPFDRLIVAQTLCDKGKLLTKDKSIRKNCKSAVWE